MFTFGSDLLIKEVTRQHQEEILKEAARIRMLNEAIDASRPKSKSRSKILATVGKELSVLGADLVERYGIQPESGMTLSQQGDPEGCS